MIESLKNTFFSTKLTALLLVVFAAAIGAATFIENDFGTAASKDLIFNTRWFEMVIFLLGVNLIGNIFKYKMFKKEKLTNLTYHVALIIIVIGAGVTRYVSFEGAMHIREGEMSNLIVSDDTFLKFKVDNQKKQQSFDKKLYLNRLANKKFEYNFNFDGKEIGVAFKDFIPNSIDTVIKVKEGKSIIEIVTVAQGNRVSRYLEDGTTQVIGSLHVAFNDEAHEDAIQITTTDGGLTVLSPYELNYMSMDDQSTGVLSRDTLHSFKNRRLYSIGEIQLVYKTIHESAAIKKISLPKENPLGEDALVIDVTCNKETREVTLFGGKGYVSNNTIFQLDELNFSMSYGSKHYTTPFNIFLNDFKMEKYPGSMSPSSYESEVTLIDNRFGGVEEKQRIYMNNILDYDGYRFFQSSYDNDELGTVLAVNHDFWGTMITYIGYSLLFLGMILTLINKKSRFAALRNNIKKLRTKTAIVLLVGIGSLLPNYSYAQQQEASAQIEIDAEHADKFGKSVV